MVNRKSHGLSRTTALTHLTTYTYAHTHQRCSHAPHMRTISLNLRQIQIHAI